MLLSNRFMSCHGVNAVPLLLINMVCVGGFQFDKFELSAVIPKGSKKSAIHLYKEEHGESILF